MHIYIVYINICIYIYIYICQDIHTLTGGGTSMLFETGGRGDRAGGRAQAGICCNSVQGCGRDQTRLAYTHVDRIRQD